MDKRLILDVGSGIRPKGIVNVDLFQWKEYQNKETLKKINNPIKADAQHLPFREKVFAVSYCFHTLEHVANVRKGVAELIRVTRDLVAIRVPHRFGRNPLKKRFGNFFRTSYLRKLIQSLGYDPEIGISHGYPIPLPKYITIHIYLRAYQQPFNQKEFVKG